MVYISIDRERIRLNAERTVKLEEWPLPVIAIEGPGKEAIYVREVEIHGPSKVVYKPDQPDPDDHLSTAWIEVQDGTQLTITV